MIIIFGFPQKTDGPCVPGTTWQGMCNRLCIEWCMEQYMVDGCSEDLDYLRKHWKARVKKSHRKADKYNQKKKRKAVEDRTATNRKLSEQQQARCERWAAATRDILEAHPGASMREYRNPRRLPASRQMWRQGQAVLPLHQSSGYPCRPIRQPVWQPRVGSVPSERRGTEAFGRDSEDCDQSEG